MGDIKLIAGNNDRLRLLIDESRAKIDLFAIRWAELAGRVPKNYLLPQFDGLTNVLTNINAEVTCRKFASLHGYENLRSGRLSFEEVQGISSRTGNLNNPNFNIPQRSSYYDNSYRGLNNQVDNQITNKVSYLGQDFNTSTPGYYLNDSKFVQKGNTIYNPSQNNSMINAGRLIEH